MAVATPKAVAWTDSRALALAKQEGTHKHPTEPGFLMQVSPKGHAVYRWRFVNAKGKEDVGKFGVVGPVTKGAHISLDDALKAYKKKRDADKALRNTGVITLDNAFAVWFQLDKRGGVKKSEETLADYKKGYERYLKPEAEHWELAYTTADDWEILLLTVKKRSPSKARVLYWVLHGIYEHYVTELELLEKNPLKKRKYKNLFSGDDTKKVVKRQIAAIDLKAFIAGIHTLTKRVKQSQRALLILLLSGWRRSAVFRMKWAAIDWERGTYTVVRKEKTDSTDLGNSAGWKWFRGEMALNHHVMEYLKSRRAEGGEAESEYVFPSRHGNKPHMVDVRGSLEKACKEMGYKITPHDLRRTFATIAEVVLDGNLRLVGLLMAHSQPGTAGAFGGGDGGSTTTGKYVVRNLQAERISGTKVADAILEIAGVFPMYPDTAAKFKERGIDIEQLALVSLDDDDTDAMQDEGAAPVTEDEAA